MSLGELQAQLESRHKALQAEIMDVYRQSLHVDTEKQVGPVNPLLLGRSQTLWSSTSQLQVVKGSHLSIDMDAKHSPSSSVGMTPKSLNRASPVSLNKASPASRVSLPSQSSEPELARPPSSNRIIQNVSWHRWEAVFGIMILLNGLAMLAEEQYRGSEIGYTLGVRSFDTSPKKLFPGASTAFNVLNVLFVVIFTLELMLRVHHERLKSYRSLWIWFDTLIVLASWMLICSPGTSLWIRPSAIRMLRVVRVFALVELMQDFKKLNVMIRSLKASAGALMWCMALILFTQTVAALTLQFLLAGVYDDLSIPEGVRHDIFEGFGTSSRAMLTMFQVMFSNWSQPCWLLVQNVSECYGVLFVLYRCVLGFALLKVVSSMFIAETHKICQGDSKLAALEKKRDARKHKRDLRQLFHAVDASGDGKVSWWEMQRMFENQNLLDWFQKMNLDSLLLTELFKILMKGGDQVEEGHVLLDEFVAGVLRVEGGATALDVFAVTRSIQRLSAQVDAIDIKASNRCKPFASILS